MTTFKAAMRAALSEAVGLGPMGPIGPTSPHKPRGGSIVRQDGGYILELLGEPATVCPHCHKAIPRPATRRRRLVQVVAGGRVLSVEIEA